MTLVKGFNGQRLQDMYKQEERAKRSRWMNFGLLVKQWLE